jgi:hypothetical protein
MGFFSHHDDDNKDDQQQAAVDQSVGQAPAVTPDAAAGDQDAAPAEPVTPVSDSVATDAPADASADSAMATPGANVSPADGEMGFGASNVNDGTAVSEGDDSASTDAGLGTEPAEPAVPAAPEAPAEGADAGAQSGAEPEAGGVAEDEGDEPKVG